MHEMHLYEYAVIRIVPSIEREEFFNAGLIMFCKREKFLKAKYYLDPNKFRLFPTELDIESLKKQLQIFDTPDPDKESSNLIQSMDVVERFRWLTAVRSTCIQTSRPHSGLTSDPEKTFELLFTELVM
ncbi:MAG: DUF3037 domain-containing protein [Candidatus Azobacteroides sp.]|nr:DUF3037 domain-containing protein [Candidatus Azobacteroides sp.]